MRRLFAGSAVVGLIVATGMVGSAAAAGPDGTTRIAAPAANHVVRNGRVLVVVRSSARPGALRVTVDGRSVTRFFRRSGRSYRARLRLGRGLRHGVNELVVRTGRRDFDRVRFVVARRDDDLLKVGQVRHDGREAPVRLVVRAQPGTTLKAWVNGRPTTHAFQPEGHAHVGRLGANDGLRAGRNRVSVLAHRTDRKGRAHYDFESRTFTRRRGRLTAGAGRDRLVEAQDGVTLYGSVDDTNPATGDPAVRHRWEIVDQPPGAQATLRRPTTRKPAFRAGAPGDYKVRMTATAPNGSTSTDTVTVSVRANTPPIGWRLDTLVDERGTIRLNGEPLPGTAWQCPPGDQVCPSVAYASYAVFNRETLEPVESGSRLADPAGMKFLADRATFYNKAPTYLMVVNISGYFGGSPDGTRLLKMLGAQYTADPLQTLRAISVIGVPGSPPGSAFMSDPYYKCCGPQPFQGANLSGYLRLNPLSASGDFEFVFDDQLELDTDADPDPSRVAVKAGDRTYARSVPTDGSAGFFLVRLDSRTLELERVASYVTNAPDGSPNAAETQRLADDLAAASASASDRGALLVVLQSFGAPKGGLSGVRNTPGWQRAGAAIGRLGGNAQVFIQQNRGFGVSPGKGGYAFIGRTAMSGPASESSQSLTSRAVDGKLHGLIARGRDNRYQPLIADPGGTVNFDLVKIVNRPTAPGNGFAAFTRGEAEAAKFLGRDSDVIGVCERPSAQRLDPPCDVRAAYHERLDVDWATILTQLGSNATNDKCKAAGPGFTPEECQKVRALFQLEIQRRNRVANYFTALQRPFLGAQTAALVDVARIAEEIRLAVKPPAANNAVSHTLNIMSFVTTKVASLAGGVCTPCGAVGGALAGAFGLAGYLTQHDGGADVIGPQVRTAASRLGGDLFDRYERVSAYFATLARIVLSDATKTAQIADVVNTPGKWQLGFEENTVEQIRIGTRQAIYQSLFPVAYPVLYNLGTAIARARDWYCWGGGILISKHLFQKSTSPGGEIVWFLTDERYLGDNHLLAVGAVKAVNTLYDAHIPAPPESLTDQMFRDTSHPLGGIGLYRLAFYSPQNFQVFPQILQQHFDGTENKGFATCSDMPNPPGNAG